LIECFESQIERPVCPRCEKPVDKVICRAPGGMFGKRFIDFWAVCKKVLGVSQRNGYWMG
jgi:hypothetical protein